MRRAERAQARACSPSRRGWWSSRSAPLGVRAEEAEGQLDLCGRNDVTGAGYDGEFTVAELPVSGDPVLERAVVVAVAGKDQRGRGDLREVCESVARGLSGAMEHEAQVLGPVPFALPAVLVGLEQLEHQAHVLVVRACRGECFRIGF